MMIWTLLFKKLNRDYSIRNKHHLFFPVREEKKIQAKSPCFKISDIPESKQITITIMGTEKGKNASFGNYKIVVRNTAPK